MKQTLGAILREQAAGQAAYAATAAEQATAAQIAQAREDAVAVTRYFGELKVKILTNIGANKRAPVIEQNATGARDAITRLLGLHHFFTGQTCMGLDHPAHEEWKGFQKWAKSQELSVDWHAEHGSKTNDAGYPEEFWWVLRILPTEAHA